MLNRSSLTRISTDPPRHISLEILMPNTSMFTSSLGTAVAIHICYEVPTGPGAYGIRPDQPLSAGGFTWKKLQKLDHPTQR